MSKPKKPGQPEGLENDQNSQIEEPLTDLERLEKLTALMEKQNTAILLLTTKLVDISTNLEKLGDHQDQTDTAIIEVAKRIGGGGGGGKGDWLTQIIPYLMQPRGSGPLEKMAMKSFMENLAFSTLTTRRIARKQFGDEYANMIKEMEAELSGSTES